MAYLPQRTSSAACTAFFASTLGCDTQAPTVMFMQDHPAALASWICSEEWRPKSQTDQMVSKKGRIRVSAILNYLLMGQGPLASTGCDHGAIVNTRGDGGQPDLQLRFVPAAPPVADGVNAYAEFGRIKEKGEYWPGGYTIQLLGIRPK